MYSISFFSELQCGLPTTIDNGYLTAITGYKVADAAHYECNFGFEMLRSDSSSICQPNGEWSSAPLCSPISKCRLHAVSQQSCLWLRNEDVVATAFAGFAACGMKSYTTLKK